tara:strand:- start:1429 stop:1569 length:141 start_codon:yes stop_codon:yes gene_type:complete
VATHRCEELVVDGSAALAAFALEAVEAAEAAVAHWRRVELEDESSR